MPDKVADIELKLLLEAIYRQYHYDFRGYAFASIKRRMAQAKERLDCRSYSLLQDRILHEPELFSVLLGYLTVQVSEVFRDPSYYLAIREHVIPHLRTYPSLKIWIAGCSTGEEAYSFAIMLREEGLEERAMIYATDINPEALRKAEAGVYELDRMKLFTTNYQQSGGKSSLSDYYTTGYGRATFDKSLRRRIVFSDHSLVTDAAFAEVQMISCRNVLIYFDRALQDRAIGLFKESLARKGFLGLGSRENLRFSAHSHAFDDCVPSERIYQRRGDL